MKLVIKIVILFLGFGISNSNAQLTLEICQSKALANYPLINQYELIKQSDSFNLSNINKAYFPQLTISAKATYQSDVIDIPIDLPLFTFEPISKDQYQIVGEINQAIWDGGGFSAQKKLIGASTEIDERKLDVELYTIKDRVNQIFFGILLINEYLKRNEALQSELETNLGKVSALRDNGVATDSDVDVIKVEIINANQKRTELISNRKTYIKMLSLMIGVDISEKNGLSKPDVSYELEKSNVNNRPELKLFESQNNLFSKQLDLVDAGVMPKVSLFFQSGYGKPGFNLLKNEFDFYYIGGLRFTWNFSGLYTISNNYELIETNQNSVNLQKETFLFNNNLKTEQQKIEIEKLKNLITNDDEIIKLRTNIKKTSEAKVENGTLSVSDLIRDINNENFAKLDKDVHEIQLLMAIYNYKYLLND